MRPAVPARGGRRLRASRAPPSPMQQTPTITGQEKVPPPAGSRHGRDPVVTDRHADRHHPGGIDRHQLTGHCRGVLARRPTGENTTPVGTTSTTRTHAEASFDVVEALTSVAARRATVSDRPASSDQSARHRQPSITRVSITGTDAARSRLVTRPAATLPFIDRLRPTVHDDVNTDAGAASVIERRSTSATNPLELRSWRTSRTTAFTSSDATPRMAAGMRRASSRGRRPSSQRRQPASASTGSGRPRTNAQPSSRRTDSVTQYARRSSAVHSGGAAGAGGGVGERHRRRKRPSRRRARPAAAPSQSVTRSVRPVVQQDIHTRSAA